MVSTQRLRNVVVVTAVFSIPAACVSVCAAADAANNSVSSKPLERHSENVSVATENGTSFTSHAIAGFSHAFDYDHPLSYLYQTGAGCGGIAIGDFDGNGLPDLFLVNGPGENRLYRQTSRMQFTDATQASGIRDPHDAWGVGATAADFDNDGDLDIYVCNYDAPNLLYENDGTGSFTEVAADYGLAIVDASYMAAPCDYDRDGDLDLYVLTNRYYYPGTKANQNGKRTGVWKYVNGEPALIGDAEKYFAMDRSIPGHRIDFQDPIRVAHKDLPVWVDGDV